MRVCAAPWVPEAGTAPHVVDHVGERQRPAAGMRLARPAWSCRSGGSSASGWPLNVLCACAWTQARGRQNGRQGYMLPQHVLAAAQRRHRNVTTSPLRTRKDTTLCTERTEAKHCHQLIPQACSHAFTIGSGAPHACCARNYFVAAPPCWLEDLQHPGRPGLRTGRQPAMLEWPAGEVRRLPCHVRRAGKSDDNAALTPPPAPATRAEAHCPPLPQLVAMQAWHHWWTRSVSNSFAVTCRRPALATGGGHAGPWLVWVCSGGAARGEMGSRIRVPPPHPSMWHRSVRLTVKVVEGAKTRMQVTGPL